MKKKADKAKVLELLHQIDPNWSGHKLQDTVPVTLSEADSATLAKLLSPSKKKRIPMSDVRRMPGDVIRDGGGYDLSLAKESVGKGWHGIIERLFEAKPAWVTIIQVKEKFGGLRFYLNDGSVRVDFIGAGSIEVPGETEGYSAEQEAELQAFRSMVVEAEAESYTVCEICGAPGKPENVGWISTLCPPCRDKRRAERVAQYGANDDG